MRQKIYLSIFIAIMSFFSISAHQTACDKKIDANSQILLNRLAELSGKQILFGHQDDLAYGIGWKYEEGRSDVKDVTGSYPALFGWELGGLDIGRDVNLDSVPFAKMRQFIVKAHEMGGVNTISWHVFNPVTLKDSWQDVAEANPTVSMILPGGSHHQKFVEMIDRVADFMLSLKTSNGELVPVLFRPFHENHGSWFWWGGKHCTAQQYKQLYQFLATYLREKRGVHNLLFVYSPDDGFQNEEGYLTRYPGKEYVDVLGVDMYTYNNDSAEHTKFVDRLTTLGKLSEKENKICAFSETGFEKIPQSDWFTKVLLKSLEANDYTKKITYVMVWRNARLNHFYAPYKGHNTEEDFLKFKENKRIKFLD